MILESVITCPRCSTAKREPMPTDACQFFYVCTGCGTRLRPKEGDCCVFCSYGSVPCPPMQAEAAGRSCCGAGSSGHPGSSGIASVVKGCAPARGVRDASGRRTAMPAPKAPTPDEYWERLRAHMPRFSPEEQSAAVALYRELAKGQAVDDVQLARSLGISAAQSRALLQRDSLKCLIHGDSEGRVLGFGGLAVVPMHHRFEVDGHALWTWCAWDSLFIPELLGRPASVASTDPESGDLVRVVVTPERVQSAEPGEAVVSFIGPDPQLFGTSAANVMAKFCHFIYFFTSRSSGECWAGNKPGTFLYSLDEAFALAKRANANNFGSALTERSPTPRSSI